MPVLKGLPISVSLEDLLAAPPPVAHCPPDAQFADPEAAGREALALLSVFCAPALVWEIYAVDRVADGRILLAGGAALTVGPHASLLAPAGELLLAAGTVGAAIDGAVRDCFESGEPLLAFLLDRAGVIALEQVGRQAFRLAEERARSLGCGLSPALGPGSLEGWPLAGQRDLAPLLPLAEIGVHLDEHDVLVPFKSATYVVGLGDYPTHTVGSLCRLCSLAGRCDHRRRQSSVAAE